MAPAVSLDEQVAFRVHELQLVARPTVAHTAEGYLFIILEVTGSNPTRNMTGTSDVKDATNCRSVAHTEGYRSVHLG
jgi:hypothetical protein